MDEINLYAGSNYSFMLIKILNCTKVHSIVVTYVLVCFECCRIFGTSFVLFYYHAREIISLLAGKPCFANLHWQYKIYRFDCVKGFWILITRRDRRRKFDKHVVVVGALFKIRGSFRDTCSERKSDMR